MEPAKAEAVLNLAPADTAEPLDRLTFPLIELEEFRRMMFWLTYQRGPYGTGTNLTRGDVLDMHFDEMLWHWSFLREVWDEEEKAMKRK